MILLIIGVSFIRPTTNLLLKCVDSSDLYYLIDSAVEVIFSFHPDLNIMKC